MPSSHMETVGQAAGRLASEIQGPVTIHWHRRTVPQGHTLLETVADGIEDSRAKVVVSFPPGFYVNWGDVATFWQDNMLV